MSTVFTAQSLLYRFHIYALVNEVSNLFRVDMMSPNAEEGLLLLFESFFPLLRNCLGSISTNRMSRLLLGSSRLTRGDKCIHCGWGICPCPPLELVPNAFPPVKVLEFSTSSILVLLLCDLKNYVIVISALPV
jgi:hypothetical protein